MKVTHSFLSKNHELEWLYKSCKVWNQNLGFFGWIYRENEIYIVYKHTKWDKGSENWFSRFIKSFKLVVYGG